MQNCDFHQNFFLRKKVNNATNSVVEYIIPRVCHLRGCPLPQEEKRKDKLQIDAMFRPVLINDVQVKLFKEDERGRHFILRNPKNSRYIKVHESAYEIVQMFNGNNTIEEIGNIIKSKNIPLTADELLTVLAEDGFIQNLEHARKTRRDPFSFKIELLSLEEKYLANLHRVFSFVKTRVFKVFYAVFCFIGISLFISSLPAVVSSASEVLKPETSILPLLIFFPCFLAVDWAHEFAHALVYHHYGGKSVKMGFESHFLIPFAYTDTPDARWMTVKQNIYIFLAGPLTSLFLADVFMYLYLLDSGLRPLWAINTLFYHLAILMNLSPVLRTDGYFMMQAALKFPNILDHGIANIKKMLQLIIRKISFKEYRRYFSQYSLSERKVLVIYSIMLPTVAIFLVFSTVILGLHLGIARIFSLSWQILTGTTSSVKAYILWILSLIGIVPFLIGIAGTLIKTIKRT